MVNMAVVASLLAGASLAVAASLGLVTTIGSTTPEPVNKPLVVYGRR